MEEIITNILAQEANALGFGKVSSHIWQACCIKFGSGGTPKANNAYERLMKAFLKEMKKNNYESKKNSYATPGI